jgi:hypothetical protein
MKLKNVSLALLLAALATNARQPQPATIEGFVTSNVVSVLPNAKVGVESLTRGVHREAVTNTSGYYIIDELQSGAYSVYAEVPGYGCIIYPHVVLMPGQHMREDFVFVRTGHYPSACQPTHEKDKGK